MNFREFYKENQKILIIDSHLINQYPNPAYLRRQIVDWQRKQWLLRLRRGFYTFNDKCTLAALNPAFVANKLYYPSYVSLEWALSYYQLIPERVCTLTSVSTRKTALFTNTLGNFSYQKIKTEFFYGFNEQNSALIASPEKALIDFFYFNKANSDLSFEYFDSLRLQNLEILDFARMSSLLAKYKDSKIEALVELLEDYAGSY